MQNRVLLAALLLIGSVAMAPAQPLVLREGAPAGVGVSADRLTRIDRVMNEYVTAHRQAGMVVLLARNGQIVHYKGYGQNSMESGSTMPRDGIFRIASQTKAIVSVAALLLFEEGAFLLDDPVSKYIPAFRTMKVLDKFNPADSSYTTTPAKRPITIRQLLTHTSGLDYPGIGSKEMTAIYAKARIPSGIGTPAGVVLGEAMNRLAALPLAHQPGDRWTYGLSDDLLGYLVEVVSGQPLDQFLRTRLFDPLGMKDTWFYLPTALRPRLLSINTEDSTKAVMQMRTQGNLAATYPTQDGGTYFSGGAGLSSTAFDYAVFLQMLLNKGEYNGKRILAPATVRLMTTNQIGELNVGDSKFGLGVAITSAKGAARLPLSEGSFDWGGFFGTTYWADPKEGIVALLMTQKYPNSHADLNDKFRVLVYQALTTSQAPAR
jgi:CubicO group peptidase (beta-lactamase class C family)